MITKVTAPPFESLTDTQKLVVQALRGKSKTPKQLMPETRRNYHTVQRALKDLEAKNWVEIDPLLSGGKANSWKLKQVPTDGIEVVINTGVGRESVSFNRYIETVARQLGSGLKPKIERESEEYFKGLAGLAYYAAVEFIKAGSVSETQLLEVRSVVQRYVMALEDAHAIGVQILEDERIWHGDTLAEGVIRKTDRHLTPAELVKYAKMITGAFGAESEEDSEDSDSDITEFETEEGEDGNADD